MPGIVVMDERGADRPGAINEAQGALGKPMVNGDRPLPGIDGASGLPNGNPINGGDHLPVTGKATIPESLLELPPEIQHITFGYQPLGKLIARASQQCFNDLSETIQRMADLPVPNPPNMANGAGSHPGMVSAQSIEAATKRRLAMMEFAREHHGQFIKILVLSNWSRKVEQVGKLIDLNTWFREQDTIFDWASHWVGMLRLNMANAKIPNPDIKTALEVLSTGKASWTPDVSAPMRFTLELVLI
jgi:mediator of RNA polymerase II transcription subunit 14